MFDETDHFETISFIGHPISVVSMLNNLACLYESLGKKKTIPSKIECSSLVFSFTFLKDFFIWTIFKSLYWICYNIASFFSLFNVLVFWLSSPTRDWTCRKEKSSALEGEVLTTRLLGKSLSLVFLRKKL